MNYTRSELINQHLDSFPVLPANVMRLMQVTRNPDCSVKDVVETIQSDQSLCLTILKFANSVLFGRPQKVDSVKMAVVILGFNEVQRIAMAKALFNSFSKIARQYKEIVDNFWLHSFVCGICARHIAKNQGVSSEIAFMGGLIHDIGKLIMLETFTDDYQPDIWMTGFSKEEKLHQELGTFSFTHDMLGGQLLRKWLFPESLISVVAYHHRPAGSAGEKVMALIVQLADFLSFFCCNQELPEEDDILLATHSFLPEIKSQWQLLGLSLTDEDIVEWFSWLLSNHDESSQLKQAFAG